MWRASFAMVPWINGGLCPSPSLGYPARSYHLQLARGIAKLLLLRISDQKPFKQKSGPLSPGVELCRWEEHVPQAAMLISLPREVDPGPGSLADFSRSREVVTWQTGGLPVHSGLQNLPGRQVCGLLWDFASVFWTAYNYI